MALRNRYVALIFISIYTFVKVMTSQYKSNRAVQGFRFTKYKKRLVICLLQTTLTNMLAKYLNLFKLYKFFCFGRNTAFAAY